MSKQASKTAIGVFVIGALGLAVAGVIFFGSGKFFTKTKDYVMFFSESVKGLDIGAPVSFRGVKVGSVKHVGMQLRPEDMSIFIPVIIESEVSQYAQPLGKNEIRMGAGEQVEKLIARGMRAQIEPTSLVTGKLMISLDFFPGTPAKLIGTVPDLIEIPTVPSAIEELSNTFRKIPIEKISQSLVSALNSVEKLAGSPELKDIIQEVKLAIVDIRQLINNVNQQVSPLAAKLDQTLVNYDKLAVSAEAQVAPLSGEATRTLQSYRTLARGANSQVGPLAGEAKKTLQSYDQLARNVDAQVEPLAAGAQQTMASARGVMSEDAVVIYDLETALREIAAAARSIRFLTDYLKQHPEALLQGKGAQGGKRK